MRDFYEHEFEIGRQKYPSSKPLPLDNHGLWTVAADYLRGRDLVPAVALYNGWYASQEAGDTEPRLVMVGTNSFGFPYWQARAFYDGAEKRYQSTHGARENSLIICWPLGETDSAVLMEGPIDALAAACEGFVGVAMLGNTAPPECVDYAAVILRGYEVSVLPDTDDMEFGGRLCGAMAVRGIAARLISSRPYKDLCAAPADQRAEILRGL